MKRKICMLLLVMAVFPGCRNNLWEEYIRPLDGVARQNLLETISNDPRLSLFAGWVVQSGWDQELSATRMYTVWAPDNNAMAAVGSEITGNPEKLKVFIANHIVADVKLAGGNTKVEKIKMASGKRLVVDNGQLTIDGVKLASPPDIPATNGVLHIIGAPLTPRKTLWELVESNTLATHHSAFLKSISRDVFDASVATQTGIDPITGRPVYDTLSGMVWQNAFIENVADLLNEDSVYTAFLLTDDVYQMQYNRYKRFFNAGTKVTKTDSLTNWSICKDLVFPGYLEQSQLNGFLMSAYGVKVPLNSNAVVETHPASNGILYVISQCDIPVQDKILPIIIEAEDTTKMVTFATGGRTGYTRQKLLASGGFDFVLYNHLANPGILRYDIRNVNSVKYKYYWKAVNDFNYNFTSTANTDTVKQSLGEALVLMRTPAGMVFGTPIDISAGMVSVTDTLYETASEVLLGETNYVLFRDWFMLQVTGSGKNTPLTLDYIKLVPVFD